MSAATPASEQQKYTNFANQIAMTMFRRMAIPPAVLANFQRPQVVERARQLLRANYGPTLFAKVALADPNAVVDAGASASVTDFLLEAATQYVATALQLGVTTTPHFGVYEHMTYLGGGLRDWQKLPVMRSHDHGHDTRYVDYWVTQDGRLFISYGPCPACYITGDVDEMNDDPHVAEASDRLLNGWLINL